MIILWVSVKIMPFQWNSVLLLCFLHTKLQPDCHVFSQLSSLYPAFAVSHKLNQTNFLKILLKALRSLPHFFHLNTHSVWLENCWATFLLTSISEQAMQLLHGPFPFLSLIFCVFFPVCAVTQSHASFVWASPSSPSLLKSSLLTPSLELLETLTPDLKDWLLVLKRMVLFSYFLCCSSFCFNQLNLRSIWEERLCCTNPLFLQPSNAS